MKNKHHRIITLAVGQMQTNCYLLADQESKKCFIIDPGDDSDYIQRVIADNDLVPQIILATHGHFDHIMGVTELKLAYNIPFIIHPNDEFLVNNMGSSAKHFLGISTDPPPTVDGFIKDGHKIKVGELSLQVIHTPGHTPGSVCFYSAKEEIVFCGDLLFAHGGVGRTDFSYGDRNNLQESVNKIIKLPKDTVLYSGHGFSSKVKDELIYHTSYSS